MPNPQSQMQYLLDLVKAELAALDAERETLCDAFIATGNWRNRDVNFGETLALAKIRGRLEAIIESQKLVSQQLA